MKCKFGLVCLLVSCAYSFNIFAKVEILMDRDENQEFATDLSQVIEILSEDSLSPVSILESYLGPILSTSGIDGDAYEYSISQNDKQFLGNFQGSNLDTSQAQYKNIAVLPGSLSLNDDDPWAKGQENSPFGSGDKYENEVFELAEGKLNQIGNPNNILKKNLGEADIKTEADTGLHTFEESGLANEFSRLTENTNEGIEGVNRGTNELVYNGMSEKEIALSNLAQDSESEVSLLKDFYKSDQKLQETEFKSNRLAPIDSSTSLQEYGSEPSRNIRESNAKHPTAEYLQRDDSSSSIEETSEETSEETIEETSEETIEETSEEAIERTSEETIEETSEETIEETSDETERASVENSGTESPSEIEESTILPDTDADISEDSLTESEESSEIITPASSETSSTVTSSETSDSLRGTDLKAYYSADSSAASEEVVEIAGRDSLDLSETDLSLDSPVALDSSDRSSTSDEESSEASRGRESTEKNTEDLAEQIENTQGRGLAIESSGSDNQKEATDPESAKESNTEDDSAKDLYYESDAAFDEYGESGLSTENNSVVSEDELSLVTDDSKEESKLDTDALEITGEKSDEQKAIDLEILTQKAETEVADTAEDPTEQELNEDIEILEKLLELMEEGDVVSFDGELLEEDDVEEILGDLQVEVQELERLDNLQDAVNAANKELSKAESTDGSEELEEYVEVLMEVLDEMIDEDLVELDGDLYDIGGIQELVGEIEEEIVEEEAEEESQRLAEAAQDEIDDVDRVDNSSEDIEDDIDALEKVIEVLEEYGGSVEINAEEMSYLEIEELVESLEIELDKQQENEELEELGDDAQAELNDGNEDLEDDLDALEDILHEMEDGDTVEINDIYYDEEAVIKEIEGIEQAIEIEENLEEVETLETLSGIPEIEES